MKIDLKVLRAIEADNARQPVQLTEVPKDKWPSMEGLRYTPSSVWRNRRYLVQIFDEHSGIKRVTVNRTSVAPNGRWEENIPWEALQDIKRSVGMGDMYAVEVYPRDCDVVDVANMRHLWVTPEPLNIGWFIKEK